MAVRTRKSRVKYRLTTTIDGEKYTLILHRLPGRGKIDPKVIREAVIKVRDERLAKKKRQRSEPDMPGSPKPERTSADYSNNVFVNCPFDAEYLPLFRALIFTIEYCGFFARCALEVEDSGEVRVEKIIRLIRDSRLSIHDISRTESNAEGLPRFNMPYEFGIFTGFQRAGNTQQRKKAALVLDREQYRYQKFLSDIAGQDIKSHRGDTEQVVKVVRDWLRGKTDRKLVGSGHMIVQFRQFQAELPTLLSKSRLGTSDLDNYRDFHELVTEWIAVNNVRT